MAEPRIVGLDLSPAGRMGLENESGPGAIGVAPDPANDWIGVADMAKRTCSIDGCDNPHDARGWCSKHYLRWKANGTTDDIRPDFFTRFWSKVNKNGPIPERRPDLGPCWIWTAYTDDNNYGRFNVEHRMEMAHRVAFVLAGGVIPDGYEVDHLCFVRPCQNPGHLEAVTHEENSRRSTAAEVNAARQLAIARCPVGHEYDEANTGYRADGRRRCRACDRARTAARRAS